MLGLKLNHVSKRGPRELTYWGLNSMANILVFCCKFHWNIFLILLTACLVDRHWNSSILRDLLIKLSRISKSPTCNLMCSYLMSSRYVNHCCLLINWTSRKLLQWNLNQIKYKCIVSRKCIRKCCLQNVGHFAKCWPFCLGLSVLTPYSLVKPYI